MDWQGQEMRGLGKGGGRKPRGWGPLRERTPKSGLESHQVGGGYEALSCQGFGHAE